MVIQWFVSVMHAHKTEWKQFGLLILLLIPAVSIALTILHTINYQRYIQEETEKWLDRGFTLDFVEGYVDFDPWRLWGIGPLVIPLDIISGVLWIVSTIIMLSRGT